MYYNTFFVIVVAICQAVFVGVLMCILLSLPSVAKLQQAKAGLHQRITHAT